jgi:hypothetical protein
MMAETTPTPWVIELFNSKIPVSLKLRVDSRLVVGRNDKRQSAQPDIDLGPYGAEELGVSRQHLALHTENDNLFVTDLQSNNGTLLNDTRLEQAKPHTLKNNDVLQLGRMQLTVRVIISPTGCQSASAGVGTSRLCDAYFPRCRQRHARFYPETTQRDAAGYYAAGYERFGTVPLCPPQRAAQHDAYCGGECSDDD